MSAPEQNPNPAERAGGVRNKPEQPKSDEPDFNTQIGRASCRERV